ncbi:MAG: hypothetical protein J6W00_04710 [Lentisphaeria bacterium]|nr:hypothetical protein [Lentisphaeria bacterium]
MKWMKFSVAISVTAICAVLYGTETKVKFSLAPKAENIAAARTFDVNYILSQETVKAQFAKGNPNGMLTPSGIPMRFDYDILSTTNYGLQIGENRASVRYDGKDNFPSKSGTIEMTIKNIDWEYTDKKVHVFFCTISSNITLYVYKHSGDGIGVYLKNNKSGKSLFLRAMPKDWKLNSIHHLAYTWDGYGNFSFHLDGKKISRQYMPLESSSVKYFAVGPLGKFGRNGQSSISRLRIYDRALSDREIALIAGDLIPELKDKMIAEKDTMMAGSPWFKTGRPKLGLEALDGDYVPYPFENVAVKGSELAVWERKYNFGGNGLLDQVSAKNENLLRKSVNMTLNGKELKFGNYKVVKQQKGRVEFTKSAANAKVQGTFEYDGMVHFKVTLKPGEKVNELTLRMPMTKEASELLNFIGATDRIGGGDSPTSSKASNTFELSTKPGTLWKKRFGTHVWLGSTRSGIQFFAGSEQYYFPRQRNDLFEIIRNADGSADFVVKMIVKPLPENAPEEFTLEFGFIATPVKPLPKGWRAMTMSAQYDAYKGNVRGSLLVYWPNEWAQISLDPEPHRGLNKERTRAKVKADRAAGRKIMPYWNRRHLPISEKNKVNPDVELIYDDWSTTPQRPRAGRFDWMRCSGTTEWIDYLVWCIDQWGDVFGTIDGAYFDEMILDPNINARSGGGYVDYDGVRRPTYSWLAERNFYKRMHYVITKRSGNKQTWSIAHNSATSMMQMMSQFTVFLTGEHLYSGYFVDMPGLLPPPEDKLYYYSYCMPMERVKGEFYHRQWGAVIAWLPCMKNQKDIMTQVIPTRDMLSRIMHADVIYWPLWCNKYEILKLDDIRRKWDIGNDAVKFIPYWENKELTCAAEGSCISYYDKNGEKMALVSNLSRKNQEFKITLPAGTKSVVNAENGKAIGISGNMVTIPVKRNDFSILIIK